MSGQEKVQNTSTRAYNSTALPTNERACEERSERTLNTIARELDCDDSFANIQELLQALFNEEPLESQPIYVAHTGCGDGSLLKALHQAIKDTIRGSSTDRFPLRFIGIDSTDAVLAQAAGTLAHIDHLLIKSDVHDPGQILLDLKNRGVSDIDTILHVRSFAAHEWSPPAVQGRHVVCEKPFLAGDDDGSQAKKMPAAHEMYQDVRGRLQRWANILGRHGLIALAEHVQPEDAENYLMAAAEAGLLPRPRSLRKHPRTGPVTRTTLSHLDRHAYSVRYACASDIPILVELEEQCWAQGLRAPEPAIRDRVIQYPEGQLVVELKGALKGCVYSQRIEDVGVLDQASFMSVGACHRPRAPIVQLLALNISPDAQDQRLGDQLLEFMLQRCELLADVHRVVGVTRCKDYGKNSTIQLRDYIALRNQHGELVDTVLRFHERHGAVVRKLIPGYRPNDRVNGGAGVLVEYDLSQGMRTHGSVRLAPGSERSGDEPGQRMDYVAPFVLDRVRARLEMGAKESLDQDQPLMEMGLDSADLLELATNISCEFSVSLSALFFFEHNTCHKVIDGVTKLIAASNASISPDEIHSSKVFQRVPEMDLPSVRRAAPAAQMQTGENIAVIGAACRLPRNIETIEQFWSLLKHGEEATDNVSVDRWQWPVDIDPQFRHRGINRGAFLEDIARFEPAFFRISPHEAELMDPQQRILLELSWQCLEDAGYRASSLAGSKTGVYVGASGSDYRSLIDQLGVATEGHSGLGTSMSVLPNRISYFYDFRGPSMQIDTACSSSLVAIHEAMQALRTGACTQALVAGINVMCHPSTTVAYYRAGMLSRDGRCKTFDAAADGYVRGEGAVVLLLKPLESAVQNGDNIYAVLKGSAVNHGGQASGLTVPNPLAQADLLVDAYQNAGVDIQTVGYIEAHGTGTSLGDPVEILGLKSAFARLGANGSSTKSSCGLGSVKTNLGHLEAAAGIAGLLKVMLSMRHGVLPASLHFRVLNPQIDFSGTPFHIVQAESPWEKRQCGLRRAGVSSFGSGGTNAHVVVEEYNAPEPHGTATDAAHITSEPVLILCSARNRTSLREQARLLLSHIDSHPGKSSDLVHIAYTLQMGREAMESRIAFTASSLEELRSKLASFVNGQAEPAAAADFYQREVGQSRDVLGILEGDEDVLHLVNTWFEKGKYHKLLQLWTRGLNFDWSKLYGTQSPYGWIEPKRISLPTYPFAKEQYWIGRARGTGASTPPSQAMPEQTRPPASITNGAFMPGASAEPILLAPLWDAWAGNLGDAPPEFTARLLVVGGTAEQVQVLRHRYAQASVLEFSAEASLENLVEQLRRQDPIDHVVWIAPQSGGAGAGILEDEVLLNQQRGVIYCFRLIKALLQLGYGRKELEWTVITWQTQEVEPGDSIEPIHAGVHGLIGSLAKEYSQWKVRLVDLPIQCECPLDEMMRLPAITEGHTYAYRNGEWYRQKLLPCEVLAQQAAPYRHGGVYAVIGGAGGIGEVLSRFLIENYQAQLIWIGRRALNADIQDKIDRLSVLGPSPVYIRADATDRVELEKAHQEIKARYSHVHGVIHSAIALLDRSIANMDEERFKAGLAAKVNVSVRLAQVFAQEPLDFVLFFSSVLSFFRPAGQSNYAAGCTFSDAYARALSKAWSCPVKVMNWGYWGSVGVVASESYRSRMSQQGIGSIEPQAGMAGLERLLRSEFQQLAFLQMKNLPVMEDLASADRLWQLPSDIQSVDQASIFVPAPEMPKPSSAADDMSLLHGMPEEILIRLLGTQLHSLGLNTADFAKLDLYDVEQWKKAVGFPRLYDRWLSHTLHILNTRANGPEHTGILAVQDSTEVWRQWEEQKRTLLMRPGMAARIDLLEAALQALPEILTGKRAAVDVLFPRGSLDMVSAVYQGNPSADYFNNALAQALASYVEERLRLDPSARLRIIEIGAGTGATATCNLGKLTPYQESIEEYCFTDISQAFLLQARKQYGANNPCLRYRVLNIEKPLSDQSFVAGQYDVAVASNILHATKNIRETVRNTKACLKRNGLLLLNELSSADLFNHLTFGLLEGWWRFEDDRVRIHGSPAIATEGWRRVLGHEGFRKIQFPAAAAHSLGQQIVIAESDGWIRQKCSRNDQWRVGSEDAECGTDRNGAQDMLAEAAAAKASLSSKEDGSRASKTHHRVIQLLSQVLGMAVEKIDTHTDFAEYGVDSILATKILYELEQEFSVALPSGMLLDHRTVDDLAASILEKVRPEHFQETVTPADAQIQAGSFADPTHSPDQLFQSLEEFRDGKRQIEDVEEVLSTWIA